MFKEYFICCDKNNEKLAVLVNEAIAKGWQPLGGVAAFTYPDGNARFYQAMVR